MRGPFYNFDDAIATIVRRTDPDPARDHEPRTTIRVNRRGSSRALRPRTILLLLLLQVRKTTSFLVLICGAAVNLGL